MRLHLAAMQGHHGPHQRQSDAEPALRTVRRAFRLGEQVEHLRQQAGVDADAVVFHAQPHARAVMRRAENDRAAVWRVLGGVVEQVRDHLHQAGGVPVHLGSAVCSVRERGGIVVDRGDLDRCASCHKNLFEIGNIRAAYFAPGG